MNRQAPLRSAVAPEPAARPSPSILVLVCLAAVAACIGVSPAHGQGFFGGQAVGGIAIDAAGIVRNLDPGSLEEVAAARRTLLAEGGPARGASPLRKVSLAGISRAVEAAAAGTAPLPPEVALLGGLERVTHVFVDSDRHDIILAGPADEARVDAAGNVVGAASGRPLMHVEDLIVALRSVADARDGGMLCSIDPAPERVGELQKFLRGQRGGGDPNPLLRRMEEILGPQTVRIGGVPADSRFARVLVAADYRLKRIGMGLEASGVDGLPSYLATVPANAPASALPRFWLEASYDPIARDADETAFRISGRSIRCLTESDALGDGGVQRGGGARDKIAGKWCDDFTARYDAVAKKHPVFAELANCIDLAVVAALIEGQHLDARAGLDLSALRDPQTVRLPAYEAPETVPTVASGVRKGGSWVVSASGGIQFQPWAVVDSMSESADVAPDRSAALAHRPDAGWWWD